MSTESQPTEAYVDWYLRYAGRLKRRAKHAIEMENGLVWCPTDIDCLLSREERILFWAEFRRMGVYEKVSDAIGQALKDIDLPAGFEFDISNAGFGARWEVDIVCKLDDEDRKALGSK